MTRNLLLALLLVAASNSAATAQTLIGSGELYGEGVHRFFARDYQGADQLLTSAIESGSQDPRAYYFRGLAREMFGGGGDMDFEEGARLEAAGRSGPMIGYSLSRVQGMSRSKLEKARRHARVQAAQQRALAAPATPPSVKVPDAAPPAATDPFKSGEGVRSSETEVVPEVTAPKADSTIDPFSDEQPMTTDPAPTADPAGTDPDPFGGTTGDDPFK
jgi:hypothetical protein